MRFFGIVMLIVIQFCFGSHLTLAQSTLGFRTIASFVDGNEDGTGVYLPIKDNRASHSFCEIAMERDSRLQVKSIVVTPAADIVRVSIDKEFVFGIVATENAEGTVYKLWGSAFANPFQIIATAEIQLEGLTPTLENFVVFPAVPYRLLVFSQLHDEAFEAPVWTIDFSPKELTFSRPIPVKPKNRNVGFADYRAPFSTSGISSGKNSCYWVSATGIPTIWKKERLSQPTQLSLDEMGGDRLNLNSLMDRNSEGWNVHGYPRCDVSEDCQYCLVSLASRDLKWAFLVLWDLSRNSCVWLHRMQFRMVEEVTGPWDGLSIRFVKGRRFSVVEPGCIQLFDIVEKDAGPEIKVVGQLLRANTQPVFCQVVRSPGERNNCMFILQQFFDGQRGDCVPELIEIPTDGIENQK